MSVKPQPECRFINENFNPKTYCAEVWERAQASILAGQALDLVAASRHAFSNESEATPMHSRGIETTLEIVGYMLGDLIDRCEDLEKELRKIREAAA